MGTSEMPYVIRILVNNGTGVENENDDPESVPMAHTMNQLHQKNASVAVKQTKAIASTTNNIKNNKKKQMHEDCEDLNSVKGRFSWKIIGGQQIPYIIRVIKDEELKFVSARMVDKIQQLKDYLCYLNTDIYTCISVKTHFITDDEALLLNIININDCDSAFGKEKFFAGKDYIVSLEDVQEFYTFIEICYKSLVCNTNTGRKEKCGFIKINSGSVVPYCIKDDKKYVPLFYFEGTTEKLIHQAVKIENWNLAYLKFCCKVQGIKKEYFADLCTVTSLDKIKKYFTTDTHFEDFWPSKIVGNHLKTNFDPVQVNLLGIWIRRPPEENPVENTIPHALTASAPVIPQNVSVILTYQNELSANQMGSEISHRSSLENSADLVPPLDRPGNTAPVIGQYVTTMNNPMANKNVMSHSNQMQQLHSQCVINNNRKQQQQQQQRGKQQQRRKQQLRRKQIQLQQQQKRQQQQHQQQQQQEQYQQQQQQQQQHQQQNQQQQQQLQQQQQHQQQQHQQQQHQQQQQQQQQQQIITTQIQQSYSGQSEPSCLTDTHLHCPSRNIGPILITTASEIIDLLSPSSSPVPPNIQETSLSPILRIHLTKIPERNRENNRNTAAYKIQNIRLEGRIIHCINAKPHIYSHLLITLDDLVQILLHPCTVMRCAHILQNKLKITLFSGNSEQLAILQQNGLIKSINPESTPMIILQDISSKWNMLNTLVMEDNRNIYQSAGGPSIAPTRTAEVDPTG